MAQTIKKGSRSKGSILDSIRNIIFSSQGFPIILTLIMISILLILFRMKGIEVDYKINETKVNLDQVQVENKDLKARKANMLSTSRLKRLARKHGLQEPKSKQIIVVP